MREEKNKEEVKTILDVCCGSRMFWFDKKHPYVIYTDNRVMERQLIWKDKNSKEEAWLEIKPDLKMDFKDLKFPNDTFHLVVFDPPHIIENPLIKEGWQRKKYGCLDPKTWREDLKQGFSECLRVLKPNGVLIFKWNEVDFPVSEILKLTPVQPLFGHKSGKQQKTHWLTFMKLAPPPETL